MTSTFGSIRICGSSNHGTSSAYFKRMTKLHQSNNSNDEEFFYNDFGDDDNFFLGDESTSSTSPSLNNPNQTPESIRPSQDQNFILSNLISQTKQREEQNQLRLSKNWSSGNWNVRGFSLDRINPIDLLREQVQQGQNDGGSGRGGGQELPYDANGVNSQFNRNIQSQPQSQPSQQQSQQSSSSSPPPPIHVSKMTFLKSNQYTQNYNEEEDRLSIEVETSSYDSNTNEADIIAVGRTDGTIFFVSLGTEYLTSFEARAKVKAVYNDDGNDGDNGNGSNTVGQEGEQGGGGGSGVSFQVEMEMIRRQQQQQQQQDFEMNDAADDSSMKDVYGWEEQQQEDEYNENESLMKQEIPFQIIHQFQAHEQSEPITALYYQNKKLFTAGGSSGCMKVWSIIEQEDREGMVGTYSVELNRILQDAHSDKIVALKALSSGSHGGRMNDLLMSASQDGSMALWDLNSGDLVSKCHAADEYGNLVQITCADVDNSCDEHVIYLGLSTGYVYGYVASELIHTAINGGGDVCPTPNLQFLAHDTTISSGEYRGVTAIVCNGQGTMSSSSTLSAGMLNRGIITGGACGTVKQWEVIGRPRQQQQEESYWKLEQWPRLASQKLRGKAHVFEGHYSPITSLQCVKKSDDGGGGGNANINNEDRIFSAGLDGTIRIWNGSGGELYRMDGFTQDVTSLCLDSFTLVTNGMGEYVCVHDFDVDDDIETSDYIQDDENW